MFTAIAKESGWNVYKVGKAEVIANFDKPATVKDTVEKIGGVLTIYINGYQVN